MGVPERLRWAVGVVDPRPADRVLEIGCGGGVAVVGGLLRVGGTFRLCYETPPGTDAGRIAGTVEAVLREHGFATAATASESRLICVAGT